ncbi:MAG: hypothetical protein LAKADJCE_00072 [Candidatus Argoarchaeum ethanivorans]|uniref:Csa3 N-terminal domain-containing protein n=1 Tax=Candidatus Argoarchaeum ethanivorans TaxID=2608793 RepID=A0A811T1W8_9EURY|nr:MAG: hypothetical protein LAKADJCE_00072 [Candidatus Argoarchaeum ethanivorans]
MKTYISPLGFETTHIISLIVKHGIEKHDRIILLRPEEPDNRAGLAVENVKDIVTKIDPSIIVDIVHIDHHDFNTMVLSFIDLIRESSPSAIPGGRVIVNLSGGPREILVALTAASISLSHLIHKTTNFSDIDREQREIELPQLLQELDTNARLILTDVKKHEPTTLIEIASRLCLSGSTISRHAAKLANMRAIEITPHGKNKHATILLSGRVLLKVCDVKSWP